MPHSQLLRDRLRFMETDEEVVENLRAAGQLLEPELDGTPARFIEHIASVSVAAGRDSTPMIQALCKAVLLDLDLVIYCYLEAKDQQKVAEIGERTSQLQTRDRLYVHKGRDQSGAFARLKALIMGD